MRIFALQPCHIDHYWDQILPLLLTVKGDWSPDDVKEELLESRAQLWGQMGDSIEGIIITKLQIEGSVKRCVIWIAAGKGLLKEGRKLLSEIIEPWAAKQMCSYISVVGRKGWGRALPDYTEVARMYEKVL